MDRMRTRTISGENESGGERRKPDIPAAGIVPQGDLGRGVKAPRLYLYDNLKFLLIVCVVLGHAVDGDLGPDSSEVYHSLFLFLYGFHMPLFLFIAGLFHKNERIAEKVCGHIALGLVIRFLWIGWDMAVGKSTAVHFLSESESPWFMYALGAFELIAYFTRRLDRKKLLAFAVLAACFAGYDPSLGDSLILSRLIVFFPFYLAGTWIDPRRLCAVSRKRWLRLLAVLVMLLWGAACLCWKDLYGLRGLFTGRNPFYDFGAMPRYGCFYRLFCMVVSAAAGFSLICIMSAGRLPVVSAWGTRTVQVYVWHELALKILAHFGVCAHVMDNAGTKALWLLAAVLLACVLSAKCFAYPSKWLSPKSGNGGSAPKPPGL